jgi:hypothetical protein
MATRRLDVARVRIGDVDLPRRRRRRLVRGGGLPNRRPSFITPRAAIGLVSLVRPAVGYATGRRSSRVIERACVDDVAVRVVAANQRPITARSRAFASATRRRWRPFRRLLALCAEAGLVGVAVLAVDGTKLHANASQHQNLDYDQVAKEILAEADAVDRSEDERFGDRRGDELPAELATVQGRRGWLRDAKRRLDEPRAAEARPVPKSRPARLREAKRRLEKEHEVHLFDRRHNEPRQVIIRQPLTQARRQQQLLLTVTRKEVLGQTTRDDTPFVQQPPRIAIAS